MNALKAGVTQAIDAARQEDRTTAFPIINSSPPYTETPGKEPSHRWRRSVKEAFSAETLSEEKRTKLPLIKKYALMPISSSATDYTASR